MVFILPLMNEADTRMFLSRSTQTIAAGLVFLLAFSLVAVSMTHADIVFGLLLNPPTTAGPGVTSTRSGSGSWQIYAVDNSNTDFGISGYYITLANATTINHRSPVTTVVDSNGDPQTAGFSGLRSGTNVNPILGLQALPGTTPFLITGFGQSAGNFATKTLAIDAGSSIIGPTTSGTWGTYSSPFVSPSSSYANGHNWLFLAEGLGQPTISSAQAYVFGDQTGNSVAAATQITSLPDCSCGISVSYGDINNVNANIPGFVDYTFTASADLPQPGGLTWGNFNFLWYIRQDGSGASSAPAIQPASFDPITHKFHWNTTGAAPGTYGWSVTASAQGFTGYGQVVVHIIPEPATLSLSTMSIIGIFGAVRRRRA
jgi:hypothetical protein